MQRGLNEALFTPLYRDMGVIFPRVFTWQMLRYMGPSWVDWK